MQQLVQEKRCTVTVARKASTNGSNDPNASQEYGTKTAQFIRALKVGSLVAAERHSCLIPRIVGPNLDFKGGANGKVETILLDATHGCPLISPMARITTVLVVCT